MSCQLRVVKVSVARNVGLTQHDFDAFFGRRPVRFDGREPLVEAGEAGVPEA